MSDFVEEYGWLITSIIGGMVGVAMFAEIFFSKDSNMVKLINELLGGLM